MDKKECGVTIQLDDTNAIKDALARLDELPEMGVAVRALVKREFSQGPFRQAMDHMNGPRHQIEL